MLTIHGSVERITYYNKENGYTVLRLRPDKGQAKKIVGMNLEGLITVIGNFPELSPGEHVKLEGDYTTHAKHGLQFKADVCEKLLPITDDGIERYLGSGLIKGIGPQLAKRIVRQFKANTLEIIEEDPERLREVPGIGEGRTEKIINAWEEQKAVKEIMLFLHEHQVSTNLAVKIYKAYGEQSIDVVKHNPYQLEQDIYGIGFKTADKIAQKLGLPYDHPARIEAGVVFAINEMVNDGHVYTPITQLSERAEGLLEVEKDLIQSGIERLAASDRVRKERIDEISVKSSDASHRISETSEAYGEPVIYLTPFFHSEKGVAARLHGLISHPVKAWQESLWFESKGLSPEQKAALQTAVHHPVSILTGGPGTGKTTCLKALIEILEINNMTYALASPTGRAAKRLSEATLRPASTIHRLLGFSPNGGFQYDENHPLKIDFLIIDEASMLDLLLTYHVLKALRPGTQVLFVGDVDQLPSVGAGDVLRDIIASGVVPVSRLITIFRQAEDSQIVTNAHRINVGQMPYFSKATQGDFFLFPAEDAETASTWLVELVATRIPDKFGMNPIKDIQVLSPMYRGAAGVDSLNRLLQAHLNPASAQKPEQKLFGTTFRVGDKVMQIRNNYDKDVYNGDIGYVHHLDLVEQSMVVVMDESQHVIYDFSETDELVLAYAVSVHKSQGSEFPTVVVPVLTQHYVMLQRNLIYTAITRAVQLCVLVGNHRAIRIAIRNNKVAKRYSNLAKRLKSSLNS
jgi:exodeoxyribonuclease V alpha subunit